MAGKQKAWRCTVCGYIHNGDFVPDFCPICGSGSGYFEAYAEPPGQSLKEETADRWQCLNCNYVHEGATAPDFCPVCGAEKDKFEPAKKADISGTASKFKILIIGGGVAGVSAAETARKLSPDSEISLVSSETELPYYRLNLTRYLAGEI